MVVYIHNKMINMFSLDYLFKSEYLLYFINIFNCSYKKRHIGFKYFAQYEHGFALKYTTNGIFHTKCPKNNLKATFGDIWGKQLKH